MQEKCACPLKTPVMVLFLHRHCLTCPFCWRKKLSHLSLHTYFKVKIPFEQYFTFWVNLLKFKSCYLVKNKVSYTQDRTAQIFVFNGNYDCKTQTLNLHDNWFHCYSVTESYFGSSKSRKTNKCEVIKDIAGQDPGEQQHCRHQQHPLRVWYIMFSIERSKEHAFMKLMLYFHTQFIPFKIFNCFAFPWRAKSSKEMTKS